MIIEEADLEAIKNGCRSMTEEEREWAITEHEFLSEFTRSQGESVLRLNDAELAKEILVASLDYVRSMS